jgi:hypothetical protein
VPSLDDVTQTFEADVGPYIAALELAIEEAQKFAKAALEAGAAADAFGADAKIAASMLESLEASETLLMGVSELLRGSLNELGDAVRSLEQSEMYAYAATEALDHILAETAQQTASLAMIERLLAESLGVATRAAAAQAAMMKLLQAAQDGAGKSALASAAATAAAGGIIAQWWSQWGSVVHWIVMGTLEIAATAIPALIALGAAAAAMAPTFTHIADTLNYLRTATGSWSGVMAASVGPLQAAGEATVKLRAAVAPDAYIIFGAAINALNAHIGAFSQVAQQASSVLAAFATKISAELSGPLGGQLVGFFSDSVRYMIEWGQVLGNIGHIFMNFMSAFWGTSHLLLAVLVDITNVLVALTANPIIGWLIGLAGAMSFVYRWGKLLYDAFKWMGGEAAFAGLKGAIVFVQELGASFLEAAAEEGVFAATTGLILTLLPELAVLGLAVTAALAIWATVSERTKSSTDNLIASINKMPPTMANLNLGMQLMQGNILGLVSKFSGIDKGVTQAYNSFGRFGTAVDKANLPLAQNAADVQKSVDEIRKLAQEGINLATALAQTGARTGALGADMNVLAIQTALSDAKISQLNSAIDQYIGILTSATSGNADFITSMANIGSVSATTSNNLGTNTAQMSLSTTQFSKALTQMGTVGAAAWQNFDQVLTGSMEPLMDNLRMMGVTGAITSQQMNQAAMSMAVTLAQYAGSNKTAQASILGFLAAQGLTFPSFQKFLQAAKASGAGQNQLNGIVNAGTIAFSKLSQMAKNAANAMNPMVASAIDAAALKASGFNGKLNKLQTDLMNHAPSASIEADMQAVAGSYQTALGMAERTGQGMTTSAQTTASTVNQSSSKMASSFDTAKMHQLNLQNQVMSSGSSIGSHAHSAAGAVQNAMITMSSALDTARAHAQALQNYINGMHGKTINVQTVFTQTSGPSVGTLPPGFGGPGLPRFHGGMAGYAGGGIAGGSMGYDAIPAWLTKGEGILTNAAVSALGGPLAIRALNDSPARAAYGGSGGGGGATALGLSLVVRNEMSGQAVNTNQRQATLIYNRRNPGNNLSLRTR